MGYRLFALVALAICTLAAGRPFQLGRKLPRGFGGRSGGRVASGSFSADAFTTDAVELDADPAPSAVAPAAPPRARGVAALVVPSAAAALLGWVLRALVVRRAHRARAAAAPGEQPATPPAPDVDWRSKARTAVGESRAPEVADVDAAHAAGRAAIARAEAARARPTGLSAEAERRLEMKKRRAKLLGRIEAQYATWCAGELPPGARLKWTIEELEEHLAELLERRGFQERAPREG